MTPPESRHSQSIIIQPEERQPRNASWGIARPPHQLEMVIMRSLERPLRSLAQGSPKYDRQNILRGALIHLAGVVTTVVPPVEKKLGTAPVPRMMFRKP